MSSNQVIEGIVTACEAAKSQIDYIQSLAGKAADLRWEATDPDHDMLKTMARSAADVAITLTAAVKDAIPEPSP
jgi:hypothetical protein